MNIADFVSKNLINIPLQRINIFCGAGISLSAGLPTAYGLLKAIFGGISAEKYIDINEIIHKLPFEAIVELMIAYSGNNDVLGLFADESIRPSPVHIFIVKMAMEGSVNKIFTTNFDLLFEKAAYTSYSSVPNKFHVLYKESEFNLSRLGDDRVKLIKIHGSAHDIDSMKITLKAIVNKSLIEARTNVVRKAFDSDVLQKMVIMGYSCSDFFDLIPAIKEINNSETEIIFIQHCNNRIFGENIKNMDKIGIDENAVENPFKNFRGYYLETDTTQFIKEWEKQLYNQISDFPQSQSAFNWRQSLDDFIQDLNDIKYKFLATICFQIGKYDKAKELYNKALDELDNDSRGVAFIYNQLSLLSQIGNNTELAEQYMKKATQSAIGYNNKFVLGNSLEIKAEQAIKQGNYEKALEYYINEAAIRLKMKDELHLAKAYQGMAVVYRYLGKINRAKEDTQKALVLAEKNSNLWLMSDLYINMGDLLIHEARYTEAKTIINKAIMIKEKINDRRYLFNAYVSLGTACKNNQEFDEAELNYNQASLIVASDNNFQECLPLINYQLAVLYLTPPKQDITKVFKHLEIALEEYIKQDDKLGIARCKSLSGQLFAFIRLSMLNNAKQILETNYPTEWNKIKDEAKEMKIDFNHQFQNYDEETLDKQISQIQSELSTELADFDQGMGFYRLGKAFEKKMLYYLFQAVDILRGISPSEAEQIIKKYA